MFTFLPKLPNPPFFCVGLPARLPSQLAVPLLNQLFATALRVGELDFLARKRLLIEVKEPCLCVSLTLHTAQLCVAAASQPVDVKISGGLADFFCLISGREDADSLFFKRRLRVEGDTELGLCVKNFLDSFEPPWILARLQTQLQRWSGG